jgi:hypothetical protein
MDRGHHGGAVDGRVIGRWRGAWSGLAAGGGLAVRSGVGPARTAPGRAGCSTPAGTGRRSTAAGPSSSAPPSRPSRPPNPRAARTRSAVSRELSRPSTPGPWFLRTCLFFVTDPGRVHHEGPPSRPGVLAVSVSLRHQRSSVTIHRPPHASSRSATGRTSTPLRTTATVSASLRQAT